MNHIALPFLVFATIFATPIIWGSKPPTQCPTTHQGERLAYSTLYPDGSIRCTYIPNIIGLARREV